MNRFVAVATAVIVATTFAAAVIGSTALIVVLCCNGFFHYGSSTNYGIVAAVIGATVLLAIALIFSGLILLTLIGKSALAESDEAHSNAGGGDKTTGAGA